MYVNYDVTVCQYPIHTERARAVYFFNIYFTAIDRVNTRLRVTYM